MTKEEPEHSTSWTREERKAYASWLGKRSYKARLKRFGLERIQA